MSPLSVTDSLSNREEHIVELARRIGRGQKRDVFAEVYRGQKQAKAAGEIALALNLTEVQVLKAGVDLVAAHAIGQTLIKGRVAYSKIGAHKAIKDKVLKIAGDKAAIDKIPTKRKLALGGQIFVKTPAKNIGQQRNKTRAKPQPVARVAFLLASPAETGAINVGMDYREAEAAVQLSADREKLELKAFPAAHVGSLLDALNEYEPDVLHFSGHGGGQAILLDRQEVRTSGGLAVNFDVARSMIAATDKRPQLLVLAACQTVSGARVFLDVVPLVVAMSDNISDWAAAFFSRRFYGALVSGRSVGHAFEQAKAYLVAEQLQDAHLPTLLSADGVDAANVRIVR